LKVVVYGSDRRVGVLNGDDVIDVERASAKVALEVENAPYPETLAADRAPADLERFISLGEQSLDSARKAVEYITTRVGDYSGPDGEQVVVPLSGTTLRAPLAHRGVKIAMAGANFADHLLEMMRASNPNVTMDEVREQSKQRGMGGFWKLSAFVVDPESEITYPAKTKYLDFEGEVSIVIAKPALNVKAERILDYVWGYTLQNDWSTRDQTDISIGGLSFNSQKNWDTSSSMGPLISVGEITDPQDVPFQTRVNGEIRQDGNTRDMTFSFAEYLERLTRDITFNPGDLISAGTCQGTAMDRTPRKEGGGFESEELFLKVGDLVEVSSPQLGILRNKVVAKNA
jgi:2-keto-4-pentenoate hydratase/2-oxohepta-3-ene-1,7-dioic acid hydratase in catechol pathway